MTIVKGVEQLTGIARPLLVDSSGRLLTTGSGGGGGGGTEGGATELTLAALSAKIPALVSGRIPVGILTPIDVNLPAGYATDAAIQDIFDKLPTLGRKAMAGSVSVTVASDQPALPVSLSGDVATETTLASLSAKIATLGQKNMAGSMPVTIASNQAAIPVSPQGGSFAVTLDTSGTPLNTSVTNLPSSYPVNLRDSGGTPYGEGNRLPVDIGSTSVTIGGTIDTELPAAAVLADATAESAVPSVGSRLLGFNGTTWDRLRTGRTGALASALGFLNQLPVGQYLSSLPTLTDGQFHNLQVNSSGRLLVDPGSTVTSALADEEANPTTAREGANLLGYNGVTWDRLRTAVKAAGTGIGFLNTLDAGVYKSTLPTLTTDQTHPLILTDNGALYTGHRAIRTTTISQFQAVYNDFAFAAESPQVDAYDVTVVFRVVTTAGGTGGVLRLSIEMNNELVGSNYWAVVYNKIIVTGTNVSVFLKGYVGQLRFAAFQLNNGFTMTVETRLTYGE